MDARCEFLPTMYGHNREQTPKTAGARLPVLLFAVALTMSGCIGMKAEGEKVESLPDMSQFSQKPAVYLRTSKGPAGYYDALQRVTEQSRLFQSFTFDIADQPQTDYTIDMYGQWDTEPGFGSIVMVVGCATPYGVRYRSPKLPSQ